MTRKCISQAPKHLPGLITRINQDPEANGMMPHNTSLNGTVKYMKGLDLNTFRGKRIAMAGDSTLFYPTKWLMTQSMKI